MTATETSTRTASRHEKPRLALILPAASVTAEEYPPVRRKGGHESESLHSGMLLAAQPEYPV